MKLSYRLFEVTILTLGIMQASPARADMETLDKAMLQMNGAVKCMVSGCKNQDAIGSLHLGAAAARKEVSEMFGGSPEILQQINGLFDKLDAAILHYAAADKANNAAAKKAALGEMKQVMQEGHAQFAPPAPAPGM